jgi:hypothetical protein
MAEIVPIDTADRALTPDQRDITQLPLYLASAATDAGTAPRCRVAPERWAMCGGSVWSLEPRPELTGAADAPSMRDRLC